MNSNEVIKYKKIGFDYEKYIQLQSSAVQKRVEKFSTGRLYLEIGGKFLYDPHASRVLPGFMPEAKLDIFSNINQDFDIIFCVNANDIASNRQLYNFNEGYIHSTTEIIKEIGKHFNSKLYICVNLIDNENIKYAKEYKT